MTAYESLGSIKGALKLAAIDAYMVSEGFEISGHDYIRRHTWTEDGENHLYDYIIRPNERGEGGGGFDNQYWAGSSSYPRQVGINYSGYFAGVRADIDSLVDDWLELPDPDGFTQPMINIGRVIQRISAGGDGPNGSGGVIKTNYDLIMVSCNSMSGKFISTIKRNILQGISDTTGGLQGIGVSLGAALGGESKLWEAARQDVANAIDGLMSDFENCAKSKPIDWKFVFSLSNAIVAGLVCFTATTALGLALGLVTAGLKLADAVITDYPETPSASDYSTIMEKAKIFFSGLNHGIRDQEESIRQSLVHNDNLAYENTGSFYLDTSNDVSEDGRIGEAYDLNHDGISDIQITDKGLAGDIPDSYLPAIITEILGTAADIQTNCMISLPFARPESIGIGLLGCCSAWADLLWHLYHLLGDMAEKLGDNARLIRKVLDSFGQQDNQIARVLNQEIQTLINEGDYDPRVHYQVPKTIRASRELWISPE